MRATRLGLASLLSLLFSSAALAQAVTVTGRIEPAGAAPCAPAATHALTDTQVLLVSTTLDLSTVSSITQVFTGTDIGTPGCPLIDVTSVAPTSYSLATCNPTALGCTFTLDQCPSPTQGTFLIAASLGQGYAPLGAAGTALLDVGAFFPVAAGVQSAVCQSSPISLVGPDSLTGTVLYLQALNVSALGELSISNATAMTIDPLGSPCSSFACY